MNTHPQFPALLSPGLILVLSAPSGAGKTTLARMVQKAFPAAHFSVSYTTRAPRGKEQDGRDYHYVDVDTFHQMVDRNDFVEWAEVHGHFYGSARAAIDQAFADKGIAVFDIDVQGGNAIKRRFPDTVLIFILPPSLDELERRLRSRGTDDDGVIRRRLLAARGEVQRGCDSYDYLIVNDRLDDAWRQLESIVIAERARRGRVDVSTLGFQPA